MSGIASYPAGSTQLLLGNQAIARGALEAGVQVASSYPGTPSTEIIETLAEVAKERNLYVEWSTNEMVAIEVATAASFAGLRAINPLKHEGMNVAMDFLAHLNLTGVKGGLVVVVCDDPQPWSSTSENDSRLIAKWLHVPLLEPATGQEALEMTKYAFELSEKIGNFVMLRSCTRISHGTSNVVVGELPTTQRTAKFEGTDAPHGRHAVILSMEPKIQAMLEETPFNQYQGPEHPELLIVASGTGRPYSVEAVEMLGLKDSVGILHLGTTWPMPKKVIEKHLPRTNRVLVVEEVDPYIESNLRDIATDIGWLAGERAVLGKRSGHLESVGELTPDRVIGALVSILDLEYQSTDKEYRQQAQAYAQKLVSDRNTVWCAGCPHRGSLWAVKQALKLDGRDGFATGDIGCYAMDRRSGYGSAKTGSVMGAGIGHASGFGRLGQFGFKQPVIALSGDSTFFHAVVPGLINAKHNKANITLLVMDNDATAMTGDQPHPGVSHDAMEQEAYPVSIEGICKGIGVPVQVFDPFDLDKTVPALLESVQTEGQEGPRVIIMKRPCVLLPDQRNKEHDYKVWIDQSQCLGESCGCGQYCVRVFKCPGLMWDRAAGKAKIDDASCYGCGLCAQICPVSAIKKEPIHAAV
ncbi:MAG: 4Fe-4S binding protein [Chloroflexi bacterium]|nr:4Fe-4S binding protein [Chloroflexota bacterium]